MADVEYIEVPEASRRSGYSQQHLRKLAKDRRFRPRTRRMKLTWFIPWPFEIIPGKPAGRPKTDRKCSHCSDKHKAKGLCMKHYNRQRKGIPMVLEKDGVNARGG